MKKQAVSLSVLALILVAGSPATAQTGAGGQKAVEETPKEIIADQIRRQGFACGGPLSAERDHARSKPNQAVWVLKCEAATYRVRLTPDMAAHVERID
jgi:hypothetical protein